MPNSAKLIFSPYNLIVVLAVAPLYFLRELISPKRYSSVFQSFSSSTAGTANVFESETPLERFTQCAQKRNLELITSLDGQYQTISRSWNQRVLPSPLVIAFPASSEEAAQVVKCAAAEGKFTLCARNGKHSYEADSCQIVVDVEKLNQVEQTNEGNSFRLGAGLTLGKVAVEIDPYVLPMGHCSSVGLTGLVLVGGIGHLSRHLGLTADYVTAIEVVNWKGEIIFASATNQYSNYLWMARGGGAGVLHFPGIITALEVSNLSRSESLKGESSHTYFKVMHPNATTDAAVELLLAWQNFHLDPSHVVNSIFNRLSLEVWVNLDPFFRPSLGLQGYFYGNESLHNTFMETLYPRIIDLVPSSTPTVLRLNDLELKRTIAGVRSDDELVSGRHGHDLYEKRPFSLNRWKGYSAFAYDQVDAGAFRRVGKMIYESQPFSRRYADFRFLGGAVSSLPTGGSGFGHRKAYFIIGMNHLYWSDDNQTYVDEILANSRRAQEDVVREMGESFGGKYAGYVDHGDSLGTDLVDYFGRNAVRIQEIKQELDPHDLFSISARV